MALRVPGAGVHKNLQSLESATSTPGARQSLTVHLGQVRRRDPRTTRVGNLSLAYCSTRCTRNDAVDPTARSTAISPPGSACAGRRRRPSRGSSRRARRAQQVHAPPGVGDSVYQPTMVPSAGISIVLSARSPRSIRPPASTVDRQDAQPRGVSRSERRRPLMRGRRRGSRRRRSRRWRRVGGRRPAGVGAAGE
jgi:hypothetical protein